MSSDLSIAGYGGAAFFQIPALYYGIFSKLFFYGKQSLLDLFFFLIPALIFILFSGGISAGRRDAGEKIQLDF